MSFCQKYPDFDVRLLSKDRRVDTVCEKGKSVTLQYARKSAHLYRECDTMTQRFQNINTSVSEIQKQTHDVWE